MLICSIQWGQVLEGKLRQCPQGVLPGVEKHIGHFLSTASHPFESLFFLSSATAMSFHQCNLTARCISHFFGLEILGCHIMGWVWALSNCLGGSFWLMGRVEGIWSFLSLKKTFLRYVLYDTSESLGWRELPWCLTETMVAHYQRIDCPSFCFTVSSLSFLFSLLTSLTPSARKPCPSYCFQEHFRLTQKHKIWKKKVWIR